MLLSSHIYGTGIPTFTHERIPKLPWPRTPPKLESRSVEGPP